VADPEDGSRGGEAPAGCAPSWGAGAELPLDVWGQSPQKLEY